jgi:signal transduction histidine kinase
MAVGETLLERAQPWLRSNGRESIRVLLPLPALLLAWGVAASQLSTVALLCFVLYSAINITLFVALRHAYRQRLFQHAQILMIGSALSDAMLALMIYIFAGPLSPVVLVFYALMALKALRFRRYFLWELLVPAMVGPVYLALFTLRANPASAFTRIESIVFWCLVLGTFGAILFLLLLSQYRLDETRRFARQIDELQRDRQDQISELEGINSDLRVQIRRQQSLEESLRAITNSLRLDDVLSQVLDSMMQMLGTNRVSAAALSLFNGGGFNHHTVALDPAMQTSWADPLARQAVLRRSAIVVNDTLQEHEWREIYRYSIVSALSIPLIDVNNVVRGALVVVSPQRQAFSPADIRHMTSFSIQASVAIHNAELHAQLSQQRVMLEAVLRDITDGLVVMSESGAIVMANPLAIEAFQYSDREQAGLRGDLAQMVYEIQADGISKLSRELRIGEPDTDHERIYQAHASQVRIAGDGYGHIAVVLHDISDHKAQERKRVEFISMVAHELRNPLNTLNGFLKVVLQEKAGPLNELQQEFLGLADGQAEALKGRISELLEFNRNEAGRLKLHPQWANLTDLLTVTYARFQIHAEQAGLTMKLADVDDLPDVLMDSERIGQVLTNLIENAMKATASGGSVTIGAEANDTEVKIYVRDTGVGIPPEEQARIFGRFYRLERKSSQHGVHLGLGLSICQQIVEGHNGRIWVESAVGEGSTFLFTLPMIGREQANAALHAI